MDEKLLKLQDELMEKTKYAAILSERNRIMDEIYKADLPVGIWSAIKNIINPPTPL